MNNKKPEEIKRKEEEAEAEAKAKEAEQAEAAHQKHMARRDEGKYRGR